MKRTFNDKEEDKIGLPFQAPYSYFENLNKRIASKIELANAPKQNTWAIPVIAKWSFALVFLFATVFTIQYFRSSNQEINTNLAMNVDFDTLDENESLEYLLTYYEKDVEVNNYLTENSYKIENQVFSSFTQDVNVDELFDKVGELETIEL